MSREASAGPAQGEPTILICEDDPSLRELIQVVIGDGYRFAETDDGLDAVRLVHELQPDLVLLDMMLPGLSGLDVLRAMRSEPDLAETPAIVITAFSGESERREAREAGADRFVGKPFDPDGLKATVEELLARSG